MVATILIPNASPAFAEGEEGNVRINVSLTGVFTVTNAEGEYFKCENGNVSGTMEILDKQEMLMGQRILALIVKPSSSYTYKGDPNGRSFINVHGDVTDAQVQVDNAISITIADINGQNTVTIEGKNAKFQVDMSATNSADISATIQGTSNGKTVVQDTKSGIVVTGTTGIAHFESFDWNFAKYSEKKIDFIRYGDKVVFSNFSGKALNVKGAYVLKKKSYADICVMNASRIDDTSLMVTWRQVKNAKGYMVYRYNPEKKKYVKVKTIKNPKYTMFVDRNLTLNKVYSYRVKSYTVVKGKTKAGKLSYYVSAVTSSDTKGNATKITPNKTSVSGKAGAKISMKGTVTTVDGKKVCSSSLRWYSKNKKIATITKAGKLTLKAKGKTYIWAKSHNGKNVVVKVSVK